MSDWRSTLHAFVAALVLCLAAPAMGHGPKGHAEEEAGHVEERAHQPEEVPDDTSVEAVREPSVAKVMANLHPSLVHFPIALLLFAALAEFASIKRSDARLRPAASVMAAIGGIGATIATIFGWIHTGLWFGGGDAMQWHRWIGTALGLVGPLIAWLALRPVEERTLLRVLLALTAVAVLVQGWLGGELGHGPGHLFAS